MDAQGSFKFEIDERHRPWDANCF